MLFWWTEYWPRYRLFEFLWSSIPNNNNNIITQFIIRINTYIANEIQNSVRFLLPWTRRPGENGRRIQDNRSCIRSDCLGNNNRSKRISPGLSTRSRRRRCAEPNRTSGYETRAYVAFNLYVFLDVSNSTTSRGRNYAFPSAFPRDIADRSKLRTYARAGCLRWWAREEEIKKRLNVDDERGPTTSARGGRVFQTAEWLKKNEKIYRLVEKNKYNVSGRYENDSRPACGRTNGARTIQAYAKAQSTDRRFRLVRLLVGGR